MLLQNGLPSRLDLSGRHQFSADAFGLRDLLANGGLVLTIAKAAAARAVDDLSFVIVVGGPE